MQTQLSMRELTLDEIEAVSGAGFWGDLWSSISGAFTASADFLGFDGHFGYQGGGGGGLSFGNFGNALGEGLGTIWNLPNTAIGLLVGGAGYAFDHVFGDGSAQVSVGSDGVIRFTDNPATPLGAITLGQVQTYGEYFTEQFGGPRPIDIAHEDAHVPQGALLGPFYIPSNILGGLAGLIFNNGNWHGDSNWNETGPQSNPPTPW